jgi:methanogenic corrinoid protein MtbC1
LELERLRRAIENDLPETSINKSTRRLLELLKKTDMSGFQSLFLSKERTKGTLSQFVLNTVVPLINEVGDAWSRIEIEVYHEHLCTSVIQRLLHAEILLCKPKRGFPFILFATPPQELHALGLLMTEAVLADQGATTFCLGSHTPLNDIKMAAMSFKADVVALSFSFSFPSRSVGPTLKHIRHLLPSKIDIWAGGSGVSFVRRPPKGLQVFSNIQDAVAMLPNLAKQKRDRQ